MASVACGGNRFSSATRIAGLVSTIIIFRKRGVRTSKEIDQERYALKALRGDFSHLVSTPPASPRDRMYEVLDRVER
ncbi:hypothetical protein HSBAA_21660 [Vreelandella sulfidaeris]|uniref:Uncharacterized protein n=1 Tax=Vreelandella sulfidaeris TaxID=115553 RepID=A0A455U438_9GAMM|nr:hypothetical protein HSBAA_21660 [Halomonas sulfidaeris]